MVRSSYRENFWLIYPMFRLIFSFCLYTSNPATVALPEVGIDNPQSMRIAVVFPAPFAPRKPNISPLFTSNEIALTAIKSPNRLVSWSAVMTVSPFMIII